MPTAASSHTVSELPALRESIRQQRAALSQRHQQQHAEQAAAHLLQLFKERADQGAALIKVASYLACDGELNPQPATGQLAATDFFLPIISGKSLRFGDATAALAANRFGIPEPQDASSLSASELDAIIVPLVAFDERGNRLGMGGGFYDRTLAADAVNQRPLLIGYAHSLQKRQTLPCQPWDVPLDAVVTERGIWRFKQADSFTR